ncbi:MAG: hypothetical protein ABI142_00660 [Bryocella sp.]
MNTMNQIDCKTCRSHMADLLLDPGFAQENATVAAHAETCAECRAELTGLRSTFALLDEYTAPEPSPYFDTRLYARLREAEVAAPEGFFGRVRSYLLFSTKRSFQPALAGALAVVLAVGGGSAFWMHNAESAHKAPVAASAAVNDLKVLDNNQQAEQLMGQLLDQSGSEDGDTSSPTS